VKDPERYVDPSVASVQMTAKAAHEFNTVEITKYRAEHPEVFWSPEIVDLIGAYLDYNGLKVVTASMIDNVVSRLGSVGLIPDRPLEPEPIEESSEPEQTREREKHVGIDLATGEEREFSDFEINRMSADDFRKVFRPFKGNPLAMAFSRYR
jgi:hypothetical protein